LWQSYKDRGVIIWGIAAEDPLKDVINFVAQLGLTFPILFDETGSVHAEYNPLQSYTNSVYPQDWIVGVDGTIVYVNNQYQPEEMQAILEQELAKTEAP
jgi:peroxiredoxin